MMRKILLLALTGALLVAMAAGTATAKGPGSGKGSDSSKGQGKGKGPATVTYVFKGEMASVAEDGSSFEILVTDANKAGRQAAAEDAPLNLTVTPETKVELNDQEATMADLQAGDKVVVQSKVPKGVTSFNADKISAERAEEPTEPTESAPANDEPAA
jgi:hypothetical protein